MLSWNQLNIYCDQNNQEISEVKQGIFFLPSTITDALLEHLSRLSAVRLSCMKLIYRCFDSIVHSLLKNVQSLTCEASQCSWTRARCSTPSSSAEIWHYVLQKELPNEQLILEPCTGLNSETLHNIAIKSFILGLSSFSFVYLTLRCYFVVWQSKVLKPLFIYCYWKVSSAGCSMRKTHAFWQHMALITFHDGLRWAGPRVSRDVKIWSPAWNQFVW